MHWKKKISAIFWTGIFTLLPLYLTFFFLIWLIRNVEATFSQPLRAILGPYYIPGMGLLSVLILIFVIGALLQLYAGRHLQEMLNRFIGKLPVIGEIHQSIQALVNYLTSSKKPKDENVVMVHFKKFDTQLLGIVTRTDFENAPAGIGEESLVSVYLPMSYQIGGFTVYIPRSMLTIVDMSAKDALKWALIGGIGD